MPTEADLRNPDKEQFRTDILAMYANGLNYNQIGEAQSL